MPIPAGSTPPAPPTSGPLIYDPVLSRVRLSVDGLADVAPVRVERSTDQVRWATVRGGQTVSPAGGTARLDDYEFAADVTNWYRLIGPSVYDTWTRTASSWDTSDSGHPWTLVNGSAGEIPADGDEGVMSLGSVNSVRAAVLQTVDLTGSIDFTVSVVVPVTPTGAHIYPQIQWWRTDANNYYRVELEVRTDSTVRAIVVKRVGGVNTDLVAFTTVPGLTHSTTIPIRVRIQADPGSGLSNLRVKVWRADQSEPTAWLLNPTDASLTHGSIGLGANLASGNTNALPVLVRWDDLAVTAPDAVLFTGSIVPVLDGVWLKSVARPFLNRKVTVRDFSDVSRPSRNGVFEVVGRSYPVAVTDVRGSRRWTLQIRTDTPQQADDLDLMLAGGDILLVHVPPSAGRISAVPGGYVMVGDSREITPPTYDLQMRVLELPLTEVAAPGLDVIGSTVTCQSVLTAYATVQAMLDAQPTIASLLELIGDPTDVIVP